MRTIYRRNGKRISLDAWNVINDVNYPPNSLHVGEYDIKAVEVEDYPDPTLFTFTENDDGTLNVVQIPDDVLARNKQAKINIESEAYLLSTDWYVSRFAETGKAIPDDIKAARQAARDAIVNITGGENGNR